MLGHFSIPFLGSTVPVEDFSKAPCLVCKLEFVCILDAIGIVNVMILVTNE